MDGMLDHFHEEWTSDTVNSIKILELEKEIEKLKQENNHLRHIGNTFNIWFSGQYNKWSVEKIKNRLTFEQAQQELKKYFSSKPFEAEK